MVGKKTCQQEAKDIQKQSVCVGQLATAKSSIIRFEKTDTKCAGSGKAYRP